MADEKLVTRELFVDHMYLGGTDRHRGDEVELTEKQVEQLEGVDPPAVGEVGTLTKIAEEQAKADADAIDRDEERRRLDAEDVRARQTREQDRLASADQPATSSRKADRGSIESGDSLRVEKIDEGARTRRGK